MHNIFENFNSLVIISETLSLFIESELIKIFQMIGTFMLSGWVLTDTPCVKCNIPTVRKKDRSIEGFCVLCDHESEPYPLIEVNQKNQEAGKDVFNVKEPSELNEAEMMEGFENPANAVFTSPKQSISSLLGKKMLQGWTMLQDCCPHENTCNGVPLMRNRNMELFCVCCDSFIPDPTKVVHPDVEMKEEATFKETSTMINSSPVISNIQKANELNHRSLKMTLEEKIANLGLLLKGQIHPTDILQTCLAIEAAANALRSLNNLSS
jgi:uncharacterized Zn finger protein (UPF0148 family)